MKKKSAVIISVLVLLVLLMSHAAAAFTYEHDPCLNPKAMEDIVVNPDAVYGFSPNPESPRLGVYADAIDWSNPKQVAQAREARAEYHAKNVELYAIIEEGFNSGETIETIARKVSQRRNEIRLESYENDPEGLALAKQSNLQTFGDENGPTPEYLFNKYGSWQTVIEKACSTNAGMDACLGFYDEYYYTYGLEDPAAVGDEDEPTPADTLPEQPALSTQEPVAAPVTTQESASRQSTPDTSDTQVLFVLPLLGVAAAATAVATRRKAA